MATPEFGRDRTKPCGGMHNLSTYNPSSTPASVSTVGLRSLLSEVILTKTVDVCGEMELEYDVHYRTK